MTNPNNILPVPTPWTPGQLIKTPLLRANVTSAIKLLSYPPMFSGSQSVTAQAIPNNSGTTVMLDTEIADSAGGHLRLVDSDQYFGMFAGWYLFEGIVAVDNGGSTGAVACGLKLQQAGVTTIHYGMSIPCAGFFYPVTQYAKLVKMVNVGQFGNQNNDYVSLQVLQTTGSTQNLFLGSARFCQLSAVWIAALSGTTPLQVPANDAFPPPFTTLTSFAASGSTTISVADTTGMTYYKGLGGALGLETGTQQAETVTMTAPPSGLTIPVTPTTITHLQGSTVNVPVSAAFLNKNIRDTVNFLIYPPIMEYSYRSSGQTLSSQPSIPTVGTKISLNSMTVDNYTAFDGNNTWTAPVAGSYYCYGQIATDSGVNTAALGAGLTVTSANYQNGSQITLWGGIIAGNIGGFSCAVVRKRLRLNAGDTVSLSGFQHSGGSAANLQGTGQFNCQFITAWRSA